MAKTPLEKLNAKYGVKTTSKTKSNREKLKDQLDNYNTRLSSLGYEDVTDTRNWFEKVANLEQDQNVLFDIFELLGRPQQALYGAIDAATNDENVLEGALEGFKGEKKLTGKELLTDNFGWEDSDFNLLDPSSWGEMKPSDLVGFAADIFADPADIALIASTVATGGATAPITGAKLLGDVAQTGRTVSKVANVADTLSDIGGGIQKANKFTSAADNLIDASKTVKKGYKLAPFQKGAMSLNEAAFKLAGKGIKKTAKLADTGVETLLKNISDEGLDVYKSLKQGVSKTIDSSKNLGGFLNKSRKVDNLSDLENAVGERTVKSISDKVRKYASKYGDNADGVYSNVMDSLTDAIESQADWTLRGEDVIKQFTEGKTAEFYTPEQTVEVQNLLRKYNIDSTIGKDGHTLILDSDIKKLYNIQDAIKEVKLGQKMDNEVRKSLDDAYNMFMNDPELKAIYNEASEAVIKTTQLSDKLKGTTSSLRATDDYVRHNLNKDVRRSESAAFKERTYDAPVRQVNKLKNSDVATKESLEVKKKKAQSDIYKTDDKGNIILDDNYKPIRDDNYYNTLVKNKKKNIERLEAEKISNEEILKLKKGDISDVGYHYGDLGKGRDTYYWNINSSRRSTGHFGTGTYFVSETEASRLENSSTFTRKDRTKHEVNFDDYNLYKPLIEPEARRLHDGLKAINYGEYDSFDVDILKDDLKRNGISEEQFNKAIEKVKEVRADYEKKGYDNDYEGQYDSLSTIFIKELGFDGIDVRGLEGYDNTGYGSVIYDLKPNKTTPFDETKLTKSGKRIHNLINESKDIGNQLEDLKGIKWSDIDPQNGEIIKKVSNARNECYKSFTAYKNILKRKNVADDVVEKAYETLRVKKKQLTATIKEARTYANKASKGIMKKAGESVNVNLKKAFEEGKNFQKLYDKNGKFVKAVEEAYTSAADMVVNLTKKIDYEKAAFERLKGQKDAIFNKRIKAIDNYSQAIETLNNPTSQEFFVHSFEENLADFIKHNANYTAGAKKLNEALLDGVFSNPNYVKFDNDLVDGKIPYGFEKVSGTFIKNKLDGFKYILPESSQSLMSVLDDLTDKTVYVDKDLLKIFNLSKKATDNEIKPLLKVIDGMNNYMKKFSTLSMGFQVRNIIGNATNMVLSGVPASKLPEYYTKASKLWNKSDELLQKFLNNSLTDADKADWNILRQFYEGGFSDAFTKGQALEKVAEGGKGLLSKVSKGSVDLNNTVDRYNRLTLLLYANDNPSYITKLGRKDAVEAVKFALFDPTNLSDFERTKMKRLIPFYTFTKQNLLFQAENIMKNTPKYTKVFKSLNAMYDSLDENAYNSYQKDNMQIPLPFSDDEGNQLFLKANLPLSDLGEWLSDPLRKLGSSVTPLIKTPAELLTGKSLYTGEDLYYNNISKGLGIEGTPFESSADAVETILSNFGLQNVSTNLFKKVQAIIDGINENSNPQQVWAEIFRSVLQNTNEENVELSKMYDDLEVYQAAVKQLKDQGIDVPTIRDITSSNNIKLNNIKRKRTRL